MILRDCPIIEIVINLSLLGELKNYSQNRIPCLHYSLRSEQVFAPLKTMSVNQNADHDTNNFHL